MLKTTFYHAGRELTLDLSAATHYSTGDFSGNLDIAANSSPPMDVSKNLRLRVPNLTVWLECLGAGDDPKGQGLTFHDAALEGRTAPASVEVGWAAVDGIETLGTVACTAG